MVRDTHKRPICAAPFDINHALWQFTTTPQRRWPFVHGHHDRQLHLFPGKDVAERQSSAARLSRARYDLIQLESIEHFMNCTPVDNESCLMETITLPF